MKTNNPYADALERVIMNAKSHAGSFCTMDEYKQNEADCLLLRQFILDNDKYAAIAAKLHEQAEIDVKAGEHHFERGQVWENPDGELMMVTGVRQCANHSKIFYVTEEKEIGCFYSTNTYINNNIKPVNTRAVLKDLEV